MTEHREILKIFIYVAAVSIAIMGLHMIYYILADILKDARKGRGILRALFCPRFLFTRGYAVRSLIMILLLIAIFILDWFIYNTSRQ